MAYVPSRNLEKPGPEVKEFKRRTVQKMITEGPEPTKGYFIDKDTLVCGINPYTGYSYLHYREYRLDKVPWGIP